MRSLIIAVVSMLPLCSSAQEEMAIEQKTAKSVQLKLYNIASYADYPLLTSAKNYPSYTRIKSTDIIHPAFAINFGNKAGNRHELELTSLAVKKFDNKTVLDSPLLITTNGSLVYETNIAVRYEYIINLNKKAGAKFVPAIGLAASPYYTRYNYVPYVTSTYPVRETFIGLRTFVVPRINYNISKRIFLDLNIPVCITDVQGSYHKEQNPTLSTDAQVRNTGNFDAVPKYFSLRLGVGVKL